MDSTAPILALNNASTYMPINPDLKCGEELKSSEVLDDDGFFFPITFHIALRINNCEHRLNFSCRDITSGVLLPNEPKVSKVIIDNVQQGSTNPFFFDPGFSLEAMTGFQVWPGSRLLIEALTTRIASSGANSRIKYWQERLGNLNIIEVGSGVGAVGCSLAAAGANVLITDLPVLAKHGIWPNIKLNENALEDVPVGIFLSNENSTESTLFEPTRIGNGSANAATLDWFKPIQEQISSNSTSNVDLIVACDCLFLRKLIEPLLDTVSTIFEHSSLRNPNLLFTYQRRNMMGLFIGLEELIERIGKRGWDVECLAWRSIAVEDDGDHDLYLFQVSGKKAD